MTADLAQAKVTLILPTLNEVIGMEWFMSQVRKEWYDQLLVVDGQSTDGTLEYCREHGYPLLTQVSPGLWGALSEAFALARHDIIITASPDGNSLPELLPHLVDKIREGYDMVVVSRYLDGARSYDDDRWTAIGNRVYTQLINLLFGGHYTDTLVIYRAFTRDAIVRMQLDTLPIPGRLRRVIATADSWDVASSIRAAKLRLRVAEIPGDEPRRVGGQRKLSIVRSGLGVLFQVLGELAPGRKRPGARPMTRRAATSGGATGENGGSSVDGSTFARAR